MVIKQFTNGYIYRYQCEITDISKVIFLLSLVFLLILIRVEDMSLFLSSWIKSISASSFLILINLMFKERLVQVRKHIAFTGQVLAFYGKYMIPIYLLATVMAVYAFFLAYAVNAPFLLAPSAIIAIFGIVLFCAAAYLLITNLYIVCRLIKKSEMFD